MAEVNGETVAYGFLCGREYGTRKFVPSNTSGFDLLKARRKALRDAAAEPRGSGLSHHLPDSLTRRLPAWPGASPDRTVTVGIPGALHLFEDLAFWKHFFGRLGIRTVSSERYPEAVKDGRVLAGAELCAPMTALHAHIRYLLDRADLVFLPFYLEKKPEEKGSRRQLCYYTQFAPSVGAAAGKNGDQERILTPLVFSLYGTFHTKTELYLSLRHAIPGGVSPFEVSAAFDDALRVKEEGLAALREVYRQEMAARNGSGQGPFHVVLLGRPYTVLSEWMNKGIPQTFASLGVPVFYQDMLAYRPEDVASVAPLLRDIHWHYAAKILEAAEVTAHIPGAYPVLVTSFKCSPDSFVTQYVRQILESHGKPYLVLELDEHDSRLGYETRIEAAVRAFRNHYEGVRRERNREYPESRRREAPRGASSTQNRQATQADEDHPDAVRPNRPDLSDKTILFPNWDPMSLRLLVAAVRRTGLDARLLEGSEGSMRRSLRHNSGQCTPLNIVAQDFMEYVKKHGLDPARTVLWMLASDVACNIRLYPHHIRTILRAHGEGFGLSDVYVGGMSLQDISATLPFDAYLAYMFGGFLQRMGCRIRPYELRPGETDRVMEAAMQRLEEVFLGDESKEEALADVVASLEAIEKDEARNRPEVAIFGDLYARDNHVLNQDLVHFIEAHGGEVITTPYTSYARMVLRPYYWKWFLEGQYMHVLYTGAWMAALGQLEKKYARLFQRILGESEPAYDDPPQAILSGYNVRVEQTGEAMDNLLKVYYIKKHHPDVALFVQASPAFCCPGLITEAMAREIQEKTGVPLVSVTYDCTGGGKNEVILPYLEYARRRVGPSQPSR